MPRITNKTKCFCSKRAIKVDCPGKGNHSVWYQSRMSDQARVESHWKKWTRRNTQTSETPKGGVPIRQEHLRPLFDCITPAANRRTYTWDTLAQTYEGFILLDTARPKARLSWRGGLTLHRLDISSEEWDKVRTKVREILGLEFNPVKCPADWQPEDDNEHSGRFVRTTSTRAASPTFGSALTGAHGNKAPFSEFTPHKVEYDRMRPDPSTRELPNTTQLGHRLPGPGKGLRLPGSAPFPLIATCTLRLTDLRLTPTTPRLLLSPRKQTPQPCPAGATT